MRRTDSTPNTPGRRPLRVAISGLGWIAANRHIPCFRRAGAEIVAGYRPADPNKPWDFPVVPTFEGLLDVEPDIVAICSPPWAHAEQAVASLNRGCHVLVEKPMAMNIDEARQMCDASEQAGKLLCVAHSHLFDRSVMKAVQLMESGALGDIASVQAMFLRGELREGKPWLFDLPGGLMYDELPHPVYLMERFLGPVAIRAAYLERLPDRRTPRQLQATVEGQHGAGHISVVMGSAASEWQFIVVGSERIAAADLFRDVLVTIPSDGAHTPFRVIRTTASAVSGHLRGVVGSGWDYMRRRLYYGHDVLIEAFVNSISSGSPPPVTTATAVRTQGLVDELLGR